MSTYRRYIKEREKWTDIKKILENQFGGDPNYIKDAEDIYHDRLFQSKRLQNLSSILSSIAVLKDGDPDSKTSRFDLDNKEAYLFYPLESPSILAYSLDSLSYRKLFPISISSLFNRNANIDRNKAKTLEEREKLLEISTFIKNFCSKYNFSVTKIQKDINAGTIQFESIQMDPVFGPCRQYITTVLNKNKSFSINRIKDNLENFSRDYKSMFSYFSLFGFSDIYTKCTCRNYLSSYTKKRGMQNYCCSHIFYAMSMFPYYITTVLAS